MDLTYKIVRRLFCDDEVSFSRNKNFDAYDDPTVQRAVRLHHHLESVERDLRKLVPAHRVELEAVEREGRLHAQLTFDDGDARRISYLRPKDWSLLSEHDQTRPLLETLLREADAEDRNALRRVLDELD